VASGQSPPRSWHDAPRRNRSSTRLLRRCSSVSGGRDTPAAARSLKVHRHLKAIRTRSGQFRCNGSPPDRGLSITTARGSPGPDGSDQGCRAGVCFGCGSPCLTISRAVKDRELPASELLQKAVRAEVRRQEILEEAECGGTVVSGDVADLRALAAYAQDVIFLRVSPAPYQAVRSSVSVHAEKRCPKSRKAGSSNCRCGGDDGQHLVVRAQAAPKGQAGEEAAAVAPTRRSGNR